MATRKKFTNETKVVEGFRGVKFEEMARSLIGNAQSCEDGHVGFRPFHCRDWGRIPFWRCLNGLGAMVDRCESIDLYDAS